MHEIVEYKKGQIEISICPFLLTYFKNYLLFNSVAKTILILSFAPSDIASTKS